MIEDVISEGKVLNINYVENTKQWLHIFFLFFLLIPLLQYFLTCSEVLYLPKLPGLELTALTLSRRNKRDQSDIATWHSSEEKLKER